jgi:hypothetical protein
MRGVALDLLSLTTLTGLQLSHEMRVLSLLSCLGSPTSGIGYIDTILSHDRETREVDLLNLLGILLRLLANSPRANTVHLHRRSQSHGHITGISHSAVRSGGLSERRRWREVEGPPKVLSEDVISLGEGTSIQINSGGVVEVNGNLRQLV